MTELGALRASEGTKLKVAGRDEHPSSAYDSSGSAEEAEFVPTVLRSKGWSQCVEQIAGEDDCEGGDREIDADQLEVHSAAEHDGFR